VGGHAAGVAGAERVGLWAATGNSRAGALVIQRTGTGALPLVRALMAAPENSPLGSVRLAVPITPESQVDGVLDRIGDAVSSGGGTWFLSTNNAEASGGSGAA